MASFWDTHPVFDQVYEWLMKPIFNDSELHTVRTLLFLVLLPLMFSFGSILYGFYKETQETQKEINVTLSCLTDLEERVKLIEKDPNIPTLTSLPELPRSRRSKKI